MKIDKTFSMFLVTLHCIQTFIRVEVKHYHAGRRSLLQELVMTYPYIINSSLERLDGVSNLWLFCPSAVALTSILYGYGNQ